MDLRILFGWVVIGLLTSILYFEYQNNLQLENINNFLGSPEVDTLKDLMSFYESWR